MECMPSIAEEDKILQGQTQANAPVIVAAMIMIPRAQRRDISRAIGIKERTLDYALSNKGCLSTMGVNIDRTGEGKNGYYTVEKTGFIGSPEDLKSTLKDLKPSIYKRCEFMSTRFTCSKGIPFRVNKSDTYLNSDGRHYFENGTPCVEARGSMYPLLMESGEPIKYEAKAVYVDEKGILVFHDRQPITQHKNH